MEPYEIIPLIENISIKNKESWEQARFVAYIIAQVNSTKKIKITDILSFPWEKSESSCEIDDTPEARKKLAEKAKEMEKIINELNK